MDDFPARYKVTWQPVAAPALQCWVRFSDSEAGDAGPFPVLMFLAKTMSIEADASRVQEAHQRPGKLAVHYDVYREPPEFEHEVGDEWEYVSKAVVLAVPPTWEFDTFLLRGEPSYQVWWTEPPPVEVLGTL